MSYYLLKADSVVAVEANPSLVEQLETRFQEEIASGRLTLVNCVVTPGEVQGEVDFYIHREWTVLSQFDKPDNEQDFKKVSLPSRSICDLLRQYGDPFFVKLDVEHLDAALLEAMFLEGFRPPFISAEAHNAEVFAMLAGPGRYRSFNLVNGPTIEVEFKNHRIHDRDGADRTMSFVEHSAGPFGDDLPGPWMTAEGLMKVLAFEGFGWRDIHASLVISADPNSGPRFRDHVLRVVIGYFKRALSWIQKRFG